MLVTAEASVPSPSQAALKREGDLRIGSRCKAFYDGEWYAGVILKTAEDNADHTDANKRGCWAVQCDVDEVGTLTYSRQVVEDTEIKSPSVEALVEERSRLANLLGNDDAIVVALDRRIRICGRRRAHVTTGYVEPEPVDYVLLPTRAATTGIVGRAPLHLSGSTRSMASTATCPASPYYAEYAVLSPRPDSLTSRSRLAAHLTSPRPTRTVALPRLCGSAEPRSRRELLAPRKDRRGPKAGSRQSQDEDAGGEHIHKVEEAMKELREFRFSSEDDSHNQCSATPDLQEKVAPTQGSLCGSERRIESEAATPPAVSSGNLVEVDASLDGIYSPLESTGATTRFSISGHRFTLDGIQLDITQKTPTCVQREGYDGSYRLVNERLVADNGMAWQREILPPSPGSGTDMTVDGGFIASEVSTTVDANGATRSSEASVTKLPAPMEKAPRARKEKEELRPDGCQENGEVSLDKFDGMHLTPLNDKPFQALSNIARHATSVLIDRLTPREMAE